MTILSFSLELVGLSGEGKAWACGLHILPASPLLAAAAAARMFRTSCFERCQRRSFRVQFLGFRV